MKQFNIQWADGFREPQCAPNPSFPDGIDLPNPFPQQQACKAELPYPAKRCGTYIVECRLCGFVLGITTAGRPDDPRSCMVPCKPTEGKAQ